MSRTEIHRGKLIPFERENNEADKEYLMRLCKKINKEFNEEERRG